ncbi:hypothetical protein GCM10027074_42310 [Streptomyces deserti]
MSTENSNANDPISAARQRLLPDDPRVLLADDAANSGVHHEWFMIQEQLYLILDLPNGREKRRRVLDKDSCQKFLNHSYTSVKYLASWEACYFEDEGRIEAGIVGFPGDYGLRRVQELPGVRLASSAVIDINEEELDETALFQVERSADHADAWYLEFPDDLSNGYSIQIGTVTDRYRVFCRAPRGTGNITLNIMNVSLSRHDDLVRVLQKVSDSVFFELDTRYDVGLRLTDSGRGINRRRFMAGRTRGQSAPALRTPKAQYDEKPMSLYWYGRSSARLPLLEYLAYYQVLEFYFPAYSRRDALDRLRQELRDPRFEPDDDAQLARILALASRSGKGFGTEREQLKATLRACVPEDTLKEFIEGNEDLHEQVKDKKAIRDVACVNLADKNSDLISQVANRVYDIRCRIVHTKEEGGEASKELLMPFSKEADQLSWDIELVKYLAQKLLVAGATKMTW